MAEQPMGVPQDPGLGAPPPTPPRRRVNTAVVFAAVAGAVVGALVVGSIWLLGGGESGPDVSGSTPDRVGEFARLADIELSKSDNGRQNAERIRTWNRQSAERLSAAYQGAEAAVETYADDRAERTFTLLVVGARSPFPPFVPYQDAAYLRVKRPFEELREFGDVACVVRNDVTAEGGEESPESTHVVSCLRTASGATVEIRNPSGDLGNDPQRVADLVNDAWSKVG